MSQELLPCPVCGSAAELNETEDHAFVALCSDIFCTGNFGSSQPTKAEAIAAWNVQARLWENRSCPNCNWSEEDEQGFLEHLEHLPKPSRWKKFLHRFFWTHLPYLTFLYATNHLWVEANVAFNLTFITYVLFLSFEFLLHSAQSYLDKRRLDQYFNNNQTTTPTQPKENNHE